MSQATFGVCSPACRLRRMHYRQTTVPCWSTDSLLSTDRCAFDPLPGGDTMRIAASCVIDECSDSHFSCRVTRSRALRVVLELPAEYKV